MIHPTPFTVENVKFLLSSSPRKGQKVWQWKYTNCVSWYVILYVIQIMAINCAICAAIYRQTGVTPLYYPQKTQRHNEKWAVYSSQRTYIYLSWYLHICITISTDSEINPTVSALLYDHAINITFMKRVHLINFYDGGKSFLYEQLCHPCVIQLFRFVEYEFINSTVREWLIQV